MYYGYYIPVKQNNSDDIIGMIFAGMPVREVDKTINLVSGLLFLILGIVLILTILVSVLASKEIASAIEDRCTCRTKYGIGKFKCKYKPEKSRQKR